MYGASPWETTSKFKVNNEKNLRRRNEALVILKTWHFNDIQGDPKVTPYSKITMTYSNLLTTFSVLHVSYSVCGNYIYALVSIF